MPVFNRLGRHLLIGLLVGLLAAPSFAQTPLSRQQLLNQNNSTFTATGQYSGSAANSMVGNLIASALVWLTDLGPNVLGVLAKSPNTTGGIATWPTSGSGALPGGTTGDLQTNAGGGTFGGVTPGAGVLAGLAQNTNAASGLPTQLGAIVTNDCLMWGPGIRDAGVNCSSFLTPGGATGSIQTKAGPSSLSGFAPGTGVVTALGNAVNGASGLPAVVGSIPTNDCLKWGPGIADAGVCGSQWGFDSWMTLPDTTLVPTFPNGLQLNTTGNSTIGLVDEGAASPTGVTRTRGNVRLNSAATPGGAAAWANALGYSTTVITQAILTGQTSSFTASIAGSTMTVTVLGAGSICVGGAIGGAGVTAANVTTLPSGHTYGCSSSTGAYTLDGTQTLASQTVTATGQKAFTVAGCPAIALSVGQVNVVDTDLSPIAALGGLASCTAGSPAIAVLSAVSPLAAGSTDNLQFVAELPSAVIGSAFAAVVTTGACSGSSLVGGIGLGGGTVSGTFVGATCSASNYIISSLPLAPHGWNCTAIDRTTPADVLSQSPSTGNSTSAAQLNGTTAASDVIGFTCGAF